MNHPDASLHMLTTDTDGALQILDGILQSPNNIYALVDGALDEDGSLVRSFFNERPKLYVYAGTELQANADVGPILITLPKEKSFLADFLPEMGKALPCMLLASPREGHELQHFFQHRIEVKLENNNIFLFRFYDANLARPFIRSLSAQRAAKFFGPVETLVWPVPDMHNNLQWLSCSFPPQSDEIFQLSMQVLKEQPHPCWEAMDQEWKAFEGYFAEDVSLVDLCRYLLDKDVNLLRDISDEEILSRVSRTVAIAKSFELSSQYDIYTFCKLELDFFPGIHLHPKVNALLKGSAKNPDYKMHELLSLDMQDWAELKQFAEEYLETSDMKPEM